MPFFHRLPLIAMLGLTSLTAACAVDAAPVPAVATKGAPLSELEAPVPDLAGPVSSAPTATVPDPEGIARTALSSWLGVPEQRVQVVLVEPIEWPDASLGCPQPGLAYAQVVTPGYRFTLDAGGTSYFVHTDLSNSVVLCTEGGVPPSTVLPVVPGEIDDGQPWMPVY
ncbi:MAG: hypothetical protein HW404_630 [Anaerolineales bacterium]|jgi:hypothetical protein|nr:hypothetical protein [Anaerolineales bacterium]